jgi:hypothetical protein
VLCVIEGYSKLSIIGLGGYTLVSIQCDYNTNPLSIYTRICERVRTTLCHEKSLSLSLPQTLYSKKTILEKIIHCPPSYGIVLSKVFIIMIRQQIQMSNNKIVNHVTNYQKRNN